MRLAEDFVSRVKIVRVSSPVFLSLGVSNTVSFFACWKSLSLLFSHNTRTTSTLIRNFSNIPSILRLSRTLPPSFGRPYVSLSFIPEESSGLENLTFASRRVCTEAVTAY